MRSIWVGLGVASALFGGWALPRVASACSCGGTGDMYRPRNVRAAAAEADVVFEGTVRSVGGDEAVMLAVFEVGRAWRGAPGDQVTIATAGSTAACGIDFIEGTTYVVFADTDRDGRLITGACGYTGRSSDRGRVVRALGDTSRPPPVGGAGCAVIAGGTGPVPLALLVPLLAWRRRGPARRADQPRPAH